MNENVARIGRAADIFPDEAGGAGLSNGFFEDACAMGHLAPDVDVSLLHIVRETRDHRALDQLMRVLMHDVTILECARLGFVGVDNQVNGFAALAVDETPLYTARKTGAAATTETGFFHFVD